MCLAYARGTLAEPQSLARQMLKTYYYPTLVKGIQKGSRNPSEHLVWRRIELDFPEIKASQLKLAVRFFDNPTVTDSFCRDGAGSYRPMELHEDRLIWRNAISLLGMNDARYGRSTLGLGDPLNEMPAFREIIEDRSAEFDAAITRHVATKTFILDGQIYVPAGERIFSVGTNDACRPHGIFANFSPGRRGGQLFGHRLDRYDDALEQARELGLDDEGFEKFRTRFRAEVFVPESLTFDARRAHVIAAGDELLAALKHDVADMSFEQASNWFRFRDGVRAWKRSKEELSLRDLLRIIDNAYVDFQDHANRMTNGMKKILAPVLNDPELDHVPEEDLEALFGPTP